MQPYTTLLPLRFGGPALLTPALNVTMAAYTSGTGHALPRRRILPLNIT
jgi:hypothetical protein